MKKLIYYSPYIPFIGPFFVFRNMFRDEKEQTDLCIYHSGRHMIFSPIICGTIMISPIIFL